MWGRSCSQDGSNKQRTWLSTAMNWLILMRLPLSNEQEVASHGKVLTRFITTNGKIYHGMGAWGSGNWYDQLAGLRETKPFLLGKDGWQTVSLNWLQKFILHWTKESFNYHNDRGFQSQRWKPIGTHSRWWRNGSGATLVEWCENSDVKIEAN